MIIHYGIFITFTLIPPSAAYIQVHFKLDFIMEANTMNLYQTALIWVHIVCNIGYSRKWADERADDKSWDWQVNVLTV